METENKATDKAVVCPVRLQGKGQGEDEEGARATGEDRTGGVGRGTENRPPPDTSVFRGPEVGVPGHAGVRRHFPRDFLLRTWRLS